MVLVLVLVVMVVFDVGGDGVGVGDFCDGGGRCCGSGVVVVLCMFAGTGVVVLYVSRL